MSTQPTIVWFRLDLRLEDNPALDAALQKNVPIIPIYIFATQEEGDWPSGGASRWWLHHSLECLSNELKALDLKLIIRTGNSENVLNDVIKSTQANAVFWNRCYDPAIIKRDAAVKENLLSHGVEAKSFNASLLFEPWTIFNKQKKPFQVFTPFWKTCMAMAEPEKPLPIIQNKHFKSVEVESLTVDSLGLLPKIHWDNGIEATWKPGTTAAKKILAEFLSGAIYDYKNLRDRPDLPGVSRLSPYLHFGEISPRMIWYGIKQSCDIQNESVECYLRQIGWREFAYHLLYHFPQTPLKPLRSNFDHFPWVQNADQLKAWQKGKTGYPIVDAGMRQLWATGWMHNRLRMIVGSFLVKDLLISWLRGAEWFWDTLVDADLANNTLGWQWIGGCGADAAPYFRIFNPITQGEKFDPEGFFVRQWVPELTLLPNQWIHKPWETPPEVLKKCGIILGTTYPHPIVDHAEAREKALNVFHHL